MYGIKCPKSNIINHTQNPSEPYSDKGVSLRRALRRCFVRWVLSWESTANRHFHLGRALGGCKTYGGRKTYQRTRSPENFWSLPKELLFCFVMDFLYRKNRALTPERGGKRTVRGQRGPKPLFGRGVIREVFFPPPPFPPPPMASSDSPLSENSRRLWLSEIPCWKGFSSKFRRCWKMILRFSGSAKCYPCQGLGTFRQGKRLLENWPCLRERCWIFSSETATAFLSSSDTWIRTRNRVLGDLLIFASSRQVLCGNSCSCGFPDRHKARWVSLLAGPNFILLPLHP